MSTANAQERRLIQLDDNARHARCRHARVAVVSSMLVHSDGVDFRRLKPLWLSIGIFVALPALFA